MDLVRPQLGSQIDLTSPLAQSLCGCWFLNEGWGTVVRDWTGRGFNGVLSGIAASSAWVNTPSGPAMRLSAASSYLTLGAVTRPDRTRLTAALSQGVSVILGYRIGGAIPSAFWVAGNSTDGTKGVRFVFTNGGRVYNYDHSYTQLPTGWNSGWHVFAWTHKANDPHTSDKFYCDGKQLGNTDGPNDATASTENWVLVGSASCAFDFGWMAVWNRQLDDSEIRQLIEPRALVYRPVPPAVMVHSINARKVAAQGESLGQIGEQ